ncbi:hypothetical protein CDV31_002512 [Fusarium ambrosium]|uniref:Uncharacterized protein n=1 Tax=Fusarium ambrosium TaxID=131363 RepID=A0A428UWA7_9HYPO|nr:hypothetical protein CDV31_002512 [Fusarium ambrosium]
MKARVRSRGSNCCVTHVSIPLQATIAPDCNESLPGFSSAQVTSKSHNFLPADEDPVDKGTRNRPNTAEVIPP